MMIGKTERTGDVRGKKKVSLALNARGAAEATHFACGLSPEHGVAPQPLSPQILPGEARGAAQGGLVGPSPPRSRVLWGGGGGEGLREAVAGKLRLCKLRLALSLPPERGRGRGGLGP